MKRLLAILLFIPLFTLGQTKFSQLPTVLPDVNTSLVGLKYVGGTYTDYIFTLSQLATYINAATGTVTSVGLSMPSVFTVTPTEITTSGTFTVTAAGGQAANKFYATPNGTSGALGLRSMVAADLPAVGTAGTYGDATHIPSITTDAYGRVASVASYSLTGSVAIVVGQADYTGQTSTMGPTICTPSVTSTIVVSGYVTIVSAVTDAIYCSILWTDENNNSQTYFTTHYGSPGYNTFGPITIRAKGGTNVVFETGLYTSGGSINYDVGWKAVQ